MYTRHLDFNHAGCLRSQSSLTPCLPQAGCLPSGVTDGAPPSPPTPPSGLGPSGGLSGRLGHLTFEEGCGDKRLARYAFFLKQAAMGTLIASSLFGAPPSTAAQCVQPLRLEFPFPVCSFVSMADRQPSVARVWRRQCFFADTGISSSRHFRFFFEYHRVSKIRYQRSRVEHHKRKLRYRIA